MSCSFTIIGINFTKCVLNGANLKISYIDVSYIKYCADAGALRQGVSYVHTDVAYLSYCVDR